MDAKEFQSEARRVERLLYRIAWSYLGDEQDVEDAVQDALIRAWEKRQSLRNVEQFKPWIARIVTNQCKDALRKRRHFSIFPLEAAEEKTAPQQAYSEVMEAMERLAPELRLLMTLHYVDGYAVREIAGNLGIPEGTVKTRMRRAREQLARTLSIEWEDML